MDFTPAVKEEIFVLTLIPSLRSLADSLSPLPRHSACPGVTLRPTTRYCAVARPPTRDTHLRSPPASSRTESPLYRSSRAQDLACDTRHRWKRQPLGIQTAVVGHALIDHLVPML